MDIKQRIELAKLNLKKAETAKITAETQKQAAEKQRDEIIQQMAADGVTPETISAEINKLDAEIQESLTNVENLIPRV